MTMEPGGPGSPRSSVLDCQLDSDSSSPARDLVGRGEPFAVMLDAETQVSLAHIASAIFVDAGVSLGAAPSVLASIMELTLGGTSASL